MTPYRFHLTLEPPPDGAIVLQIVDGNVKWESDGRMKLSKTNQTKAAGDEEE
jgi:hypothetical protein